MKNIIFIILKVLELIGVIIVYLLLCRLGYWIETLFSDYNGIHDYIWYNFLYMSMGFMTIVVFITTIGFIIYLINMLICNYDDTWVSKWIILNKEWSTNIYNKFKIQ